MRASLPSFDDTHVLVAGDVMLDRYWLGPTERISPEAPVPVVRVDYNEERAGGAGNVAVNLTSLGVGATLVGFRGDDEAGVRLEQLLSGRDVVSQLRLSGAPTLTKLRVLSRNQQLIRLDFEGGVSAGENDNSLDAFEAALSGADVVILSDYGKGTLNRVADFIASARKAGRPVIVDPKGRDFSRYRGATLITPNLAEFEGVVGPCPDDATLVGRAAELIGSLDLDALLVTRSERGMTLVRRDAAPLHLPAKAREVYDVTGAGDTVIAVVGAGLAAGCDLADAAALANVAAGLVVAKRGTATVTRRELQLAVDSQGLGIDGIVTEAELRQCVRRARERGERVVMTNGCFDILHAGHAAYLADARALGERLIVAVNSDDSVRTLKGVGRPVNTLADRMAVLAALAAVDWVVPFYEDTPARLIGEVLPDVLVKGGDYSPKEIAGGDAVRAHGGEVRVLPFRPGRSTSSLIESLRDSGTSKKQ